MEIKAYTRQGGDKIAAKLRADLYQFRFTHPDKETELVVLQVTVAPHGADSYSEFIKEYPAIGISDKYNDGLFRVTIVCREWNPKESAVPIVLHYIDHDLLQGVLPGSEE